MKEPEKLNTRNFKFLKLLGNGSYAHVVSAKCVSAPTDSRLKRGENYALKIVSKVKLLVNRKAQSVVAEKKALRMMDHPNIIKLYSTFQDEQSLYFVLELTSSMTLLDLINKMGKIPSETAKKIVAQIVCALEHIHNKNVVHRDIKPENILLSTDGIIKVTDFGSCKILQSENEDVFNAHSFVGTAAYISPEIINGQEASFECDLWSLGCTIFHMFTGFSPFADKSEYLSLTKVIQNSVEYPDDIDFDAKALIQELLKKYPSERIGSAFTGGLKTLKNNKFFDGVNFEKLENNEICHLIHSANEGDLFDDFESLYSKSTTLMNSSLSESERMQHSLLIKKYDLALGQNESIIFSGIIEKRKSVFNHRRELILTSKPSLSYYDPKTCALKGVIHVPEVFNVEMLKNNFFAVIVPGREYKFKSVTENAKDWVDILNKTIVEYIKSCRNK